MNREQAKITTDFWFIALIWFSIVYLAMVLKVGTFDPSIIYETYLEGRFYKVPLLFIGVGALWLGYNRIVQKWDSTI